MMGTQVQAKLVSIIIPCYNRADLIAETLDSIINQTYSNWECIIVDDRSTDNFMEVIIPYTQKDSRFQLHHRPKDYPKGANACRNIGLTLIKGEYVIFFDSDDLMVEEHIKTKVETIESGDYNFIVAKSKYFNNPDNINPMNYRELGNIPITATNFITKKINWITFDLIIKTKTAKKIRFTEKNQSAEEYNYFVKLLLKTNKAISIDKYLTLRRFHANSYQGNLIKSRLEKLKNTFYYYWDTYQETYKEADKESRSFLLHKSLDALYKLSGNEVDINKKFFLKTLVREKGILKGLKNYVELNYANKI